MYRFFFFKQTTAYEMRISDWSSDVCSSDLAKQDLNEYISMTIANTPEMKGVFSRVKLNSELSRRDVLLIALMSSENRAAASLAHHYPGGYAAFIAAMNAKAKALGMTRTHSAIGRAHV